MVQSAKIFIMKPTKLLTIIVALAAIASNSYSQSFNWVEQQVAPTGENVVGMVNTSDTSAVIVGYGNTLTHTTDAGVTWSDLGLMTNTDKFDYSAIDFHQNVGYVTSSESFTAVNRASNNIIANSPILKTTDGGLSWEILTLDAIGDGITAELSPSAYGCTNLKFYAVNCISASTAYISACWSTMDNNKHNNVFKTEDGGISWTVLLPDNGDNVINSIYQHDSLIYICGKETLYKKNTNNNTLTNLYPIVDKGEDDTMYFWNITAFGNEVFFPTTADSIRYTNDAGATFKTLPNIAKGYYVYKHDDNTYVVLSGKNDTKATNDAGTNWVACSAGESLWNGAVINNNLIALAKGSIYKMKITDIANSTFDWTNSNTAPLTGTVKGIATVNNSVYLAGYDDGLAVSADDCTTFNTINTPSKRELIYSSVDLSIQSIEQGTGEAGIITSRRYKKASSTSDMESIYQPGVIWTTVDNWKNSEIIDDTKIGAQYNTTSQNPYSAGCYGQDFYTAQCIDDSTFYVACQWYDSISAEDRTTHARVYKTSDACQTWDTITKDHGAAFITTLSFNRKSGYIGGNNILQRTTDEGVTVEDIYPNLELVGDNNMYINEINIVNEDTILISTTSDGIFQSFDAGETFHFIEGSLGCNATVLLSPNSWMTMGSKSKTFFTSDGGNIWTGCTPGSTIYNNGTILNDSLYALAKSVVYKIALTDLATTSSTEQIISSAYDIKVWQNNSDLIVQSKSTIENCSLYNISGHLVGRFRVNDTTYEIPVSEYAKGMYILTVETQNGNSSVKTLIK